MNVDALKRYGPILTYEPDGQHAKMAETPFGAWVLYADVKQQVDADRARQRERLREVVPATELPESESVTTNEG